MSTDLVPVMRPDDIAQLPSEERGALITGALVESKKWLEVATKGTDPTPIAEFKAWAATVAEMTKQKGLAQEIQLDALEMVRRAERGIGLAVRNGQNAGTVRRNKEHDTRANQHGSALLHGEKKSSPSDFFPGGGTQTETYAMTDGVSDGRFEEALEEAREEGNLSRANVVRKIRDDEPPVGVDRPYLASLGQSKQRRVSLPKQFLNVTGELTSLIHRLEKLQRDDRFKVSVETIQDQCAPQLLRAQLVLTKFLETIGEEI